MTDYVLNIVVQGQADGVISLTDQLDSGLRGINPAAEVAIGAFRELGAVAVNALGTAVGAVGGFIKDSVNAAGEFEAGMNNFASVAGSSLAAAGFSLDDVKAKALELGAVTQFSAAQAQDAMINLAKGGVPVADIMGQATDATLALAAAGGLELGPAADIVSKQLGVWGETGVTASQVADQLAQAANASTVDVDELAMGLSNVAGTAKTAGVDFGDLTQAMALIAPGFSSAADAGTSLKTMIAGMQPTTGPAVEMFNKLGLMTFNTQQAMERLRAEGIEPAGSDFQTLGHQLAQLGESMGMTGKQQLEFVDSFKTSVFYDQTGAFVGMEKAATLLQGAVGDLSEADKVMALQTMFGSDAIRAAAAVANAGGPGFTAMGDAMTAAGTAADQSAIKQQGFAFALDSMKGTIETIQIVIGSALLPVLTSMIGAMTESLNGVLTFAQGILSANDPLAALVTSINTVVPGFSSFVTWIQQAATSAQPLIDMLGANLTPILAAIGTVLTGAVLVALGGLVAGFVAAVAPIAALVAGLALLYAAFSNNFLGIQTIVTTVLGIVLGIVQSVGAQIVSFWQTYGTSIMAAAQAAWGGLQALISSVLQGVVSVVVAIGGQIVAFWQQNGASIMATVQTTWAQLGTIISGAIQIVIAIVQMLSSAVSTVFGAIANFISQNTASIQAVLTGAWQVIQGVITAAMGIISGVIKTVLSAIQGDWRGVWEGLKTIVTSAVSGIGSILQGLGNIVRGALGVLGGIIKSVGEGLISAAIAVGNNIIDGIKKGISAGVGALKDMVKNAAKAALDAAKSALGIASPSKAFAELGRFTMQGMTVGVERETPKAVSAVSGAMHSVVGAATKVAQAGAKSLAGTSAPASGGDMLAGLNDFVTEFLATAQSFSMKAVRGAQGFADTVGKILAVIGPAVEALGSLRTMVAPTHESVNAFGAALAYVLGEMIVTTYSFGKKSIAAAATFAESVGKILAPISTAVDAFAKLGELVTPTHGTVDRFRAALQYVLGEMIVTTYSFGPKSIAAAAVFAESVGKIMGLIGPAVDAFAKLPDLVVPSHAAVSQFGQTLRTVVAMMRAVSESAKIEFVQAAATFAESAGKMIAIIGPGVDGFTKLAEFGGVPARNITLFGVALRQAVGMLFAIGREFKAESVAAAAVFAEGAGKAVGMIGAASESMTKLKDFVAPAQTTFAAFGASLRAALATLIQVMNSFTAEAIAAAGVFGEGAGKAVGFIGNAVGSFLKLAEFTGVSQAAIDAFGVGLRATLAALVAVAQSFAVDAVAAAAVFGEGVGKAVAFIGSAVDSLTKLADFQAPADDAVKAFFLSIGGLMEMMDGYSVYFNDRMYATTKAFADGVHGAIVNLGSIAESMSKLSDFKAPAEKAISAFFLTIGSLMEMMDGYSVYFNERMYATTKAFVDGVRGAIGNLGSIADSLGKLVDFEAPADAAMKSFLRAIGGLMEMLDGMSADINTRMITTAITFTGGIKAVIGQLQGALQAFATLGETSGSAKTVTAMMQSLQSLVGQMNSYLPPNALIVGQNTVIGLINGIVSQRGALVTAMVNTVMAAVIAARQTLGIASPSKVFEQIGQYAGAGLQGGMAAMQPAIAATSAGLGISAVNATTSALRPSGGGTTNNNQRSVVIEAGAIVINGAGGNPRATADAVATELQRRIGMQGT